MHPPSVARGNSRGFPARELELAETGGAHFSWEDPASRRPRTTMDLLNLDGKCPSPKFNRKSIHNSNFRKCPSEIEI